MLSLITKIIKWMVNLITHLLEHFAGIFGWCVGTFLARLMGPILKQGLNSYRGEMARFLPEVILHLCETWIAGYCRRKKR